MRLIVKVYSGNLLNFVNKCHHKKLIKKIIINTFKKKNTPKTKVFLFI